ncbi:MAG: hypothetical protein JNN20_00085 [Betaproteobacteria bacterium]|nr:hypothetical protein [Betaproteobacteria bacterium]
MKTVLIGLLKGLGGWLAVGLLVSGFLQSQYGMRATDTIGIAIFAGLFIWAAFGLFVSSFDRWRERAAILGGLSGAALKDGKQAVLLGNIEPTGAPLEAPLDGAACVMYSYEIYYDAGQGRKRSVTNVARGVGLTPSRIVNKSGTYKLLSVPELEGESPTLSNDARIERFLGYARRATFIKREAAAQERMTQWADDDGAYCSDVAYVPFDGADKRYWVASQQHVPVGASICVFGLYSKAKGGIVPSATVPTRLMTGNLKDVAAKLKSQVVTRAVIGLGLLALIGAVVLMNQA